ncbi:hypothetical protein HRbin01_01362 [archaeon HR01]|nr:hypothetical protein HRbin01_01362 [archaeon HR01]
MESRRRVLIAISAGLASLAGLILYMNSGERQGSPRPTTSKAESDMPSRPDVKTTTRGDGAIIRYLVPPEEILPGGPPKDGIPSIDEPVFIPAGEAGYLGPGDLVVGIEYGGVVKAYPHKVMVWHEIVNDVVGGTPVAITYCPLCYTATAFIRMVSGSVTTFGVSGKLYNSDLVMYDRLTETYWSQHLGLGIMGPMAGASLERLQVDVMTWSKWRGLHPDTLVLSTDTGFSRPYGYDPYGDYYRSRGVMFPVKNLDDRLHPKAIVYGLVVDGVAKTYEQGTISRAAVLNDEVNGRPVVVVSPFQQYVRAYSRRLVGETLEFVYEDGRVVDRKTGSVWDIGGRAVEGPLKGRSLEQVVVYPAFWFAWAAFYPGVELVYDGGEPALQGADG